MKSYWATREAKIVAVATLLMAALTLACTFVYVHSMSASPQLNLFDAGVPGSPEAQRALQFAHDNHIDSVTNYSAINATPDAIHAYFQAAGDLNVSVIISLKDLLGPSDLDPSPANVAIHRTYGATTDEQVSRIVQQTKDYPSVGGYLIADELPQDSGPGEWQSDIWLPRLQARFEQVRALTNKRVMAVFYWAPDRLGFMQSVYSDGLDLMIDQYPYPASPASPMGQLADVAQTGANLNTVAGDHGWFVAQGASMTALNPAKFPNSPAPATADIVQMARLALQGGAKNLSLYYFPAFDPGSADPAARAQSVQVATAVQQIRASPEFG